MKFYQQWTPATLELVSELKERFQSTQLMFNFRDYSELWSAILLTVDQMSLLLSVQHVLSPLVRIFNLYFKLINRDN